MNPALLSLGNERPAGRGGRDGSRPAEWGPSPVSEGPRLGSVQEISGSPRQGAGCQHGPCTKVMLCYIRQKCQEKIGF